MFEDEYRRLNAAQKAAVDATTGPVLVVAGPGTGKTQLLSMRVAHILLQPDVSPENILCLTFTNKAANNMRERLGRLAGSAAHRVFVRTFHSFAGELMNLYPDYFWNGARLSHVPDAVQLEIITDILSTLPLDNPLALKFAGQFTATKDVQDALKLAKEAGLTPDKLSVLIQLNLQYIDVIEPELAEICSTRLSAGGLNNFQERIMALPDQATDELTRPLMSLSTVLKESLEQAVQQDADTGKTANTSKWKNRWITSVNSQRGMHNERKRNAWWLAVAEVYAAYRDQLHQRGFYDYADMIIEVITQLEHQPDMLASVQEQFQYVLIDEFQDTNAAQLRLAHLVVDHPIAEGAPNIMAVGDDDQSIFKFNGAELSNVLGFRRTYPTTKLIVLTDNYRSSQALLDTASAVIAQASERVATHGITKHLVAQATFDAPSTIEHLCYPTAEYQYYEVAKAIKQSRRSHPKATFAVLARSHDSLRRLSAQLLALEVPVRYEQQQNILDHEAVRHVVLVAEIVDAIREGAEDRVNQQLAQLLAHPLWGIPPTTLWQLAIANRYQPHWLESLLENPDSHLQAIGHWLLWLAAQSTTAPLPRMLEFILGLTASEHLTSPIKSYFATLAGSIDTPYLTGLSAIRQLMTLSQEFCRHGQSQLADFVRLIAVAHDNNRSINDESLFVAAQHAVELLTVHKAKGLEFDTVYVIDAVEGQWRPSSKGRKPPANLPLKPQGDDYDDFVRLMFVAITRAKHHLSIASYAFDHTSSPVLAANVIRDIVPPVPVRKATLSKPATILESAIRWPRLDGSSEKLLLQSTLENYSLSATALLNFLDVTKGGPAYFLERHLLRLPEAHSPAVAFGNAIHTALEHAQRLTTAGTFDLGMIFTAYERALDDGFLLTGQHERYLQHGQAVLRRLFETYRITLDPEARPEVSLTGLRLGKATIGGTLDHVQTDDTAFTITDYKTGKPLKSFHTKDVSQAIKAWRHRTQLAFYALLAQTAGQADVGHTITGQVMYVEAETPKDLIRSYVPSAEELQRLSQLITVIWERINTCNFPDVRHYEPTYHGIAAFEADLLDKRV